MVGGPSLRRRPATECEMRAASSPWTPPSCCCRPTACSAHRAAARSSTTACACNMPVDRFTQVSAPPFRIVSAARYGQDEHCMGAVSKAAQTFRRICCGCSAGLGSCYPKFSEGYESMQTLCLLSPVNILVSAGFDVKRNLVMSNSSFWPIIWHVCNWVGQASHLAGLIMA